LPKKVTMEKQTIIFIGFIVGLFSIVLLFISSVPYYKKVHQQKDPKNDDSLELGRTFVECELGEKPKKKL